MAERGLSSSFEGESLRKTVIGVDDTGYLRHFVRMYNDKMIDLTTLCTKRRVSVGSGPLTDCTRVESFQTVACGAAAQERGVGPLRPPFLTGPLSGTSCRALLTAQAGRCTLRPTLCP